jgi:hypothetical protein
MNVPQLIILFEEEYKQPIIVLFLELKNLLELGKQPLNKKSPQ